MQRGQLPLFSNQYLPSLARFPKLTVNLSVFIADLSQQSDTNLILKSNLKSIFVL